MNQPYWQKQTTEALFPKVLWSQPETKQGAGKLLIIGGQAQEFVQVASSYSAAQKAGAGHIRVLMPESTAKQKLPEVEYAPANSSGSFSKAALGTLLDATNWADGVLLAGDMGKNSETSLMLEKFISENSGPLFISQPALDSLSDRPKLLNKSDTWLILELSALQKLLTEIKFPKPLTSSMSLVDLGAALHALGNEFPVNINLIFSESIWSSRKGRVASTTKNKPIGVTNLAAHTAVWCIQQPEKPFEATVSAALIS